MKFDISTIFWLFFIIPALQPLLKKRLLLAIGRDGSLFKGLTPKE